MQQSPYYSNILADDQSEYKYQIERITYLPEDRPVTRIVKEVDLPDLREARIEATKAYDFQLEWLKDKYVPDSWFRYDSKKGVGYSLSLKMIDKKNPNKIMTLEATVIPEQVPLFEKGTGAEEAIFKALGVKFPCENDYSRYNYLKGYEWSYKIRLNYLDFDPTEVEFKAPETVLSEGHLMAGFRAKQYYLNLLNSLEEDKEIEDIRFFLEGISQENQIHQIYILKEEPDEMDLIEDTVFKYRNLQARSNPELAKKERELIELIRSKTSFNKH